MNIKPYHELRVGDKTTGLGALSDNEMGPIIWIGSLEQLKESKYKSLLIDLDLDEQDINVLDYNWVVTNEPKYGPTLFNYNNDCCGVVCKTN